MQYQIPASEYAALVDLYNATDGASWAINTGWLDPSAKSWFGVSTTGATYDRNGNVVNPGNVSAIYITFNQLAGVIPASLGNLSQLEELSLSGNQLTGAINFLGTLSNLGYLDLANNQLTGSIPDSLGNLSKLEQIALANNKLTGSIPDSLGNLPVLFFLDLSGNQLSGSIPNSIGSLPDLIDLYLANNQLSGSIPTSLGELSQLYNLDLSNNQLTGEVPALIFKPPNDSIATCYIQNNSLDVSTGSQSLADINALIDMGVDVVYLPQNSPSPFYRLTDVSQVAPASQHTNHLDDPIQPAPDISVLDSLQPFAGGLIADGVTPWIIKVVGSPNTAFSLSFDSPQGGNVKENSLAQRLHVLSGSHWTNGASGTTSDSGEGYAYLEGIPAEEISFTSPNIELTATVHITISGVDNSASFAIRKPFVVLVHGIRSDGTTWYNDDDGTPSQFLNLLATEHYFLQSGPAKSDPSSFIQTPKYATKSDSTSQRFDALALSLDTVLQTYEDHVNGPFANWAFTRYDIVGHSQGGVLARMLCQTSLGGTAAAFASQPVVSSANMYRGRFRRVITIGSPHNGTVLATYLKYLAVASVASLDVLQGSLDIFADLFENGDKFDPFDDQIKEINSPSLPVEARIRFRCIRTSIFGGEKITATAKLPLCYSIIGLGNGIFPGVNSTTRGEVVLPFGSDGVVDFDSQIGGGTKNSTLFMQPFVPIADRPLSLLSLGDTSHAGPEWFFGVASEDFDTHSPLVGVEVVQILDAAPEEFGPFILPSNLPPKEEAQIIGLAGLVALGNIYHLALPSELAKGDAVVGNHGPPPATTATSAASQQYLFNFEPLQGHPLSGSPVFFAEVLGPGGISTTGVSVQASGTNSPNVIVTVDSGVQGDVVLLSSYTSANGTLVFGAPILVVSNPAGTTVTGISVDPASTSSSVGDSVTLTVSEVFDNSVSSLFFASGNRALQFSSSDPAIASVDSNGHVSCLAPGTATITTSYDGLMAQTSVAVSPVRVPIFSGYSGTYSGLASTQPLSVAGAGSVTLTLANSGEFTAAIVFGGRRYSLKGSLASDGSFSGVVPNAVPALGLSLQAPLGVTHGQIMGTLTQGTVVAQVLCEVNPFNSKSNPCPNAGKYTFEIGPAATGTIPQPQGTGFATATVNASGSITSMVMLADGTKITEGGFVAGSGGWSFYSLPYRDKGLLTGRLVFEDVANMSDVDGSLLWFAPIKKSGPYHAGFQVAVETIGSVYTPPTKGNRILGFPNTIGNGQFTASNGGLISPLVNMVTLTSKNTITPTTITSDKLKLGIALSTGSIAGSFVPPGQTKPSSIKGVVFQKQGNAVGYFLNGGQSGGFVLTED